MIRVDSYRCGQDGNGVLTVSTLVEAIKLIGGDDALVFWDRDYFELLPGIPQIVDTLPFRIGLWVDCPDSVPRGCMVWNGDYINLGHRAVYDNYKWLVDY